MHFEILLNERVTKRHNIFHPLTSQISVLQKNTGYGSRIGSGTAGTVSNQWDQSHLANPGKKEKVLAFGNRIFFQGERRDDDIVCGTRYVLTYIFLPRAVRQPDRTGWTRPLRQPGRWPNDGVSDPVSCGPQSAFDRGETLSDG